MTSVQDLQAAIELAAEFGITSELDASGTGVFMDWQQGIDGRGCCIHLDAGKLIVSPPIKDVSSPT